MPAAGVYRASAPCLGTQLRSVSNSHAGTSSRSAACTAAPRIGSSRCRGSVSGVSKIQSNSTRRAFLEIARRKDRLHTVSSIQLVLACRDISAHAAAQEIAGENAAVRRPLESVGVQRALHMRCHAVMMSRADCHRSFMAACGLAVADMLPAVHRRPAVSAGNLYVGAVAETVA
jgi:hypothetical protein